VVVVAVICIAVIPIPQAAVDFSLFGGTARSDSEARKTTVFRETRWCELVPAGWDPNQQARQIRQGMRDLPDSDPRAMAMLKKLRDLWNDAPINASLDGAAVRIPGYVVPLEESSRGLKEFLLVPYFGACVHSPPPPSNQIIHVRLKRPLPGVRAMDVVWISGEIHGERSASSMGTSSYAMNAVAVDPYVQPNQ
jgi:hypothetical protein